MFIRPPFFILVIFIVFTTLMLRAEADDDWQELQSQANSAYQAGDYSTAEQAARKAMTRAEKADNGKRYQASSLNILAFIQSAQGNLNAALVSMEKAVRLGENALGRPNEHIAALLFNQGLLLQQAGQADNALPVLQQTINDYLELNHTGSGNLWQAVLAQAQLLADHSPAKAIAGLEQALAGFPATPGFHHRPNEQQRGDLLLLKGRIEFTQQHYQQAVISLEHAQQQITQATEPARKLIILELLADSYDQLGLTEKSTPIRQQALALRSSQPASMATVMQLNELAIRHQQKQEFEQAEPLYQQALKTLEQIQQTETIEQALILGNYGSMKLAQKDHKAALALFEQSYQLHQTLNSRPVNASRTAGYIGSIYYHQRQYDKAEPAFLQALTWLDSSPEADPDSVLIALENLNALYISWDKENKARPFERRAKELKTQMEK